MIRDFRSNVSDCGACPLSSRRRVWADVGENPVIAFIGEAPGAQEEAAGHPFVGPAGGELNRALTGVGVRRAGCWVTNVLPCRPPGNDISSEEALEARRCCRAGLDAELDQMFRAGIRVVVALGGTATEALGIHENISRARGSVYILHPRIDTGPREVGSVPGQAPRDERRGGLDPDLTIPIIPTYHPAALLYSTERTVSRGTGSSYAQSGPSSQVLRPVFESDLAKAFRISRDGWHPPAENFTRHCTPAAATSYLESIHDGTTIGVDIETTSFNPLSGAIYCVGIATGPESGICISVENLGNASCRSALHRLLSRCNCVFQNAKFDVAWLERNGARNINIAHDVMLLHHAISPELPHDLGFIVSIYGETPYWKGEMLSRDTSIVDYPWDAVSTYNLRDAVVLLQVLPKMLEDLDAVGSPAGYKISMGMIRPIMKMEQRGMGFSLSKSKKWRDELERKRATIFGELCKIVGTECINFASDDDLRYIMYGLVSRRMQEAIDTIHTLKRKDTLKFRAMERLVNLYSTTPLLSLKWGESRTKTGKYSVADGTLISISRKINNRISLIGRFKRQSDEHVTEVKQLERALSFIVKLREINKIDKLISTYAMGYPVDKEMRVHPSFLIHGTTTGRLSCKNPNLQNQPEEARVQFVAREGFTLLSADYSNLELRVLAYISDDDVMMDQFARGLNIHDENTKALFGIGPDHPKWKQLRKAAKIYIFGRNYGGGLEGIFQRIIEEVPDCGLTLARFRQVDEAYRKLHPKYTKWYNETMQQVLSTRRIANAFGRVRTFYGSEYDIVKEGLNTPIQGTAADVINTATIRLDKEGFPIICQVHDQLLFEIPKGTEIEMAQKIRPLMEKGFEIYGRPATFPVDITAGDCWNGMAPVAL